MDPSLSWQSLVWTAGGFVVLGALLVGASVISEVLARRNMR